MRQPEKIPSNNEQKKKGEQQSVTKKKKNGISHLQSSCRGNQTKGCDTINVSGSDQGKTVNVWGKKNLSPTTCPSTRVS